MSESDVTITFYGRQDVKECPENFHTGPKKVVFSTLVRKGGTAELACKNEPVFANVLGSKLISTFFV